MDNERKEELAILVGLLLTDGCVSSQRFVIFHNRCEAMHELFQKLITKIFGNVHFTQRIEANGTKRTQVSSKPLVEKLLSVCNLPTFRRKRLESGKFPPVKLPEFIKELPDESKLKFIQAIFSADGSVSVSVRWHKRNRSWEIRRRIELTCKHPDLRRDFLELLKSVGFSPRISGDNITLEKKKDILKFAREVAFLPGVKVGRDSSIWSGFEKNQVLTLAVKTLNFTKKQLERFKTKEDVIAFLKSLV